MAQEVKPDFGKIHVPARMLLAGCSSCGKSVFAKRLVEHRKEIFTAPFERIIYVLPKHTMSSRKDFIDSLRDVCPDIAFVEGYEEAINSCNLTLDNSHKLIIFDDLVATIMKHSSFLELLLRDRNIIK